MIRENECILFCVKNVKEGKKYNKLDSIQMTHRNDKSPFLVDKDDEKIVEIRQD